MDTEAVEVDVEPTGHFGPAHLRITAKFQCGWYQYVHSWEFDGDGNIHPRLAMGGQLNPNDTSKAHTHHMYFRVDLDIDGFSRDLFEEFEHVTHNDPGGDVWALVTAQGKRMASPEKARKWRVRDALSTSGLGAFRGYEIEVPQLGDGTATPPAISGSPSIAAMRSSKAATWESPPRRTRCWRRSTRLGRWIR